MRPLKTLSLLSISPIYCSACRNDAFFSQQALRAQCLPTSAPVSSLGSFKRLSSTSTSSPSFSYRIGASFSAKGRRYNSKQDIFALNSVPEKVIYTGRPKSGQDAFFATNTGPSGRINKRSKAAFGVADGVGGWAESGIDSADFSHGLCESMASFARENTSATRNDPQDLLERAYTEIVNKGDIIGGGSTACVAVADEKGSLSVANLGDSGFIHLRLNAVHYFSNPQTHAFNTPFQLSIVPPRILALSKIFGGEQLHDSPRDSNLSDHRVRHGDVLVFATDGVWDNLSTVDLLKIISHQMLNSQAWSKGDNGTTVSERLDKLTSEENFSLNNGANNLQTLLAVNVVREAKQASEDTRRDGPFAKEVQRFYPHEGYRGGKVDDICVVVAVVIDNTKQ